MDQKTFIDHVLNESEGEFKMLLDRFSITQRKALKGIVYKNGKEMLGKDVLDFVILSKNSMVTALKSLRKNEIIDFENDMYFINVRAFELWIKRTYINL